MRKTTLCYIEHDGRYLMLYRNKKENDCSEGKYIGVGGKFLPGETKEECLLREVREETGFELERFEFRGLVHYQSDVWEDDDMHIFTATLPGLRPGEFPVPECDEGTFEWVPISQVESLPAWEGDRLFLRAIAAGESGFEMTLVYEGDDLVQTILGN